jgi:hypothetical protein
MTTITSTMMLISTVSTHLHRAFRRRHLYRRTYVAVTCADAPPSPPTVPSHLRRGHLYRRTYFAVNCVDAPPSPPTVSTPSVAVTCIDATPSPPTGPTHLHRRRLYRSTSIADVLDIRCCALLTGQKASLKTCI